MPFYVKSMLYNKFRIEIHFTYSEDCMKLWYYLICIWFCGTSKGGFCDLRVFARIVRARREMIWLKRAFFTVSAASIRFADSV
jgi:hypothetical protein